MAQFIDQSLHPQNITPKRVIVLVEDHSLQKGIVAYLEMDGYEVTSTSSTHEFFHHFTNQSHGVAIIDVDQPDKSGLALAKYLHNNTAIRIISITTDPFLRSKKNSLISQADIYLKKPLNFRLLSASVNILFPTNVYKDIRNVVK